MMFGFRIKLKRICVYRYRKQIGDGDFVKLLEILQEDSLSTVKKDS